MLTKYDEFLCHQIGETFDTVGESSLNFAERIHFPDFEISGKFMIDCGFGVYPNRNVMEGFTCVSIGDQELRYVRASRELRPNIDEVKVGPLSWEVIEPFKKLRCKLDENEYGVSFDVVAEGRYPPSDWTRGFVRHAGQILSSGWIYFQMGRLSGWLKVDGTTYEVKPEDWRYSRDHSWGIRHAGAGEPYVQPGPPRRGGLYCFAYLHFEDWAIVHHLNEDAQGNATYFHGEQVFKYGDWRKSRKLVSLKHQIEFYDGSRRMKSGRLVFTAEDGDKIEIPFEHTGATASLGLGGYGARKRDWGQGYYMGPLWVDGGRMDVNGGTVFDEIGGLNDNACVLHCGNETGYGLIEVMVTGVYEPYGFTSA